MKSIDYQFRKTVLEPLINILNQHKEELNNIIDKIAKQNKQSRSEILKNLNKDQLNVLQQHNNTINELIKQYTIDYYTKIAKERFSSWQQSLYYTVARIPAQNLQSFMQMRVVAYTGGTKNVVHVSHWQTWLQGSKYKKNNIN